MVRLSLVPCVSKSSMSRCSGFIADAAFLLVAPFLPLLLGLSGCFRLAVPFHLPIPHRRLGAETEPGKGVAEGGIEQGLPPPVRRQDGSQPAQQGEVAPHVEDEARARRNGEGLMGFG